MDSFEKALIDAITTQFFAGVEYRTEYGMTRVDPQSTKLAQAVIDQRLPELAEKVGKKLDIDTLADDIAKALHTKLTGDSWGGYSSKAFKDELCTAVVEKYAELKAKEMIERECGPSPCTGESEPN